MVSSRRPPAPLARRRRPLRAALGEPLRWAAADFAMMTARAWPASRFIRRWGRSRSIICWRTPARAPPSCPRAAQGKKSRPFGRGCRRWRTSLLSRRRASRRIAGGDENSRPASPRGVARLSFLPPRRRPLRDRLFEAGGRRQHRVQRDRRASVDLHAAVPRLRAVLHRHAVNPGGQLSVEGVLPTNAPSTSISAKTNRRSGRAGGIFQSGASAAGNEA